MANRISAAFDRAAQLAARECGRAHTFAIAIIVVVVWAISGPLFGFSDTWQLVINTGTTIVTFLMVFLIQNTQNRDGAALQAKLDELIRVGKGHNHFIGIEHLTDTEVEEFRTRCEKAAKAHDAQIVRETKRKVANKRKAAAASPPQAS